MVDLVQYVLNIIDGNWQLANYDPMPVRIHRDDSVRLDTGERTREFDLTEANAVGVSSAPETTNTPIGTEFDYAVRGGVSVRVEGAHHFTGGHITDSRDFDALVSEVKRTIHLNREWPLPGEGFHTLYIDNENNASADYRDYYRYDFDIWFRGYTNLP